MVSFECDNSAMKRLGLLLLVILTIGLLAKGIFLKNQKLEQDLKVEPTTAETENEEEFGDEKEYKSIDCPEITNIANKTLQTEVNKRNKEVVDTEIGDGHWENAIVLKKGEEVPYGPNTSYLDIYCDSIRNDNLVFSEIIYLEDYGAGAAHPNHRVWTFNYSVKTGKELSVKDLFKQNTDGLKNLTKKVVAKLKSDLGEVLDKEIAEIPDGEERDFGLFLVESDGLEILFNQYAIAPSSAGTVRVKLNGEELGPNYLY